MEDLTALRNHYRAEVREKLELKVAKQRKEREEKKALDQAAKDEKEKQVSGYFFNISFFECQEFHTVPHIFEFFKNFLIVIFCLEIRFK